MPTSLNAFASFYGSTRVRYNKSSPDTLSRSPLGECDSSTEADVNAYVTSVTDTKPLTSTNMDAVLPEVMKLTKSG